ncbi:MAG TPA: DUF971 domain-containing protein [Tepidisphaeraceae bacterium]|nr:DUF971 domain-containing protein [Tepidisphaeraceae bacterium]
MTLENTPIRLDLKKDEKLEIEWQDGLKSTYSISLLRTMCPCALCKTVREQDQGGKKPLLQVLPGNYAKPIAVTEAELVGGYALRLEWSDGHGSGIYSFQYLREISPQTR